MKRKKNRKEKETVRKEKRKKTFIFYIFKLFNFLTKI